MLTKEFVNNLKNSEESVLTAWIAAQKDSAALLFMLENLGYLPANFEGGFLFELLEHDYIKIRLAAAKNIAKINTVENLEKIYEAFQSETDTSVKRELVSAMGRLRNDKNKPYLFQILQNEDPKVVCQAIRGLLVFKHDADVVDTLKPLVNHPNEMVRTVVYKEYYADSVAPKGAKLAHAETYNFLKNVVVNGDVLETLAHVPDDSIHLTFTSPPYYNARDYAIYPSYKDYLEFLEKVFKETHRITKEGRFLIVNTSPIIIPRVSRAHSSKRYPIPFDLHPYLVNNGWEFIDDIIWLKPEYTVKNRIGGFMQQRKPLMYKPNSVTEYLMVYRKQTDKLIDWNLRSYDSDAVEASRVGDGYETNNVWQIAPCFDKIHSAVFPVELCRRVIAYYSFKNDLVFDPFAGSGTVGRTAKSMGRNFFLTEKEPTYFEYMQSKVPQTLNAFDEPSTHFIKSVDEFANRVKL